MYKYLELHLGSEIGTGFGEVYTAEEKIPVRVLRKDYWQEIGLLNYQGLYGLTSMGLRFDDLNESSSIGKAWKGDEVFCAETLFRGRRLVVVNEGFDKVIIHPDWGIKEICIKTLGEIYLFSSSVEVMSRYLPIIVVSTINDYLSIDSAWSIKVEKIM